MIDAPLGMTWSLDGWIIATGVLCAVACALPGNFLVLRRMSMMGDAISHAVLPGIAAAFLVTSSVASVPMFIGAAAVGVLTAFATEWLRRRGRVDEGASMGVVFTTLFALGLVLIVRGADHVDLDPGCVLYGAIEYTPLQKVSVLGVPVPRAAAVLAPIALANALFVAVFYKELALTSFDAAFAHAAGFRPSLMHYALMTIVAVTTVAAFESVGNVLVVAMLIVPPAAAHLLTDRLAAMIVLSTVIAAVSAAAGHVAAIAVPAAFGMGSTSTAGMMAVAAGGALVLAVVLGPQRGLVASRLRRRRLRHSMADDDVLVYLARARERGEPALAAAELGRRTGSRAALVRGALRRLAGRGAVEQRAGDWSLTERGSPRAGELLRSHRLWESYMVERAAVRPDHAHAPAELLEHVTDADLRRRLADETGRPTTDPQGKPIPPQG
ncbi:MAG TPA: metal ABC transporter permease [Phycisphaerales bacterium]|nr:metal ABC transporter permease [Phycisphaerales bacterium]